MRLADIKKHINGFTSVHIPLPDNEPQMCAIHPEVEAVYLHMKREGRGITNTAECGECLMKALMDAVKKEVA